MLYCKCKIWLKTLALSQHSCKVAHAVGEVSEMEAGIVCPSVLQHVIDNSFHLMRHVSKLSAESIQSISVFSDQSHTS